MPSLDFRPTASLDNLRLRAALLRRVRSFFEAQGFLEVETPLLSADTVVDRHLDPIAVPLAAAVAGGGDGSSGQTLWWLQTSPEFGMKRLLAAGAEAIYQVGRAFRGDERGPLHNPEFTLVEWYQVHETMAQGIGRLSRLAEVLLARGPAETISYAQAFLRHVGLDPHRSDGRSLAAAAKAVGIAAPASLAMDDRDGWLDLLLTERVQPHLGLGRPVILYDYPASQAALACVRREDPPVAERFELYAEGIELANGYHELRDPAELRRRSAENNRLRALDGKPPLPEESRLLAAMESGLPDTTGVALGLDRVAMVAAGAKCLDEVMAFPFPRA
jgi:lysyl-tRNA synthetase class 2